MHGRDRAAHNNAQLFPLSKLCHAGDSSRAEKTPKNFMQTIEPHGGVLINRILKVPEAEAAQEHARDLPAMRLGDRQWCDLEMIDM